jgi:hypothetical protein
MGGGFPVVLKVKEALGEGVEIGEVIGREHLALDNREVDLDLIKPTGVNRGMHEREATIAVSKTLHSFGATVR